MAASQLSRQRSVGRASQCHQHGAAQTPLLIHATISQPTQPLAPCSNTTRVRGPRASRDFPARLICAAQPSTSTSASSGLGLFPSGMQQARVPLPAVVLHIEASQVLSDAALMTTLTEAVQGGCNMVALWESASNAAAMYDAALRVQEVLRGRAALLLVDRTDIAQAIGAQGVLLTERGVPTVVARRMLGGAAVPMLVGRVVGDEAAAVAAAADGANLVMVQGPGGAPPSPELLAASKANQRSGNAIPVLLSVRPESAASGPAAAATAALEGALRADVDGVAVSAGALSAVARACFDLPEVSSATDYATAILTRLNVKAATSSTPKASSTPSSSSKQQQSKTSTSSSAAATSSSSASAAPAPAAPATPAIPVTDPGVAARASRPLLRMLGPGREGLLADEKQELASILAFLEEVLAGTGELQLLRDALKALDEPFLVAVVGEFNSGKSSVINALLGRRYLAEGILPTTNEISILKFAEEDGEEEEAGDGSRLEQQADGLYVRYLPARLLQDLHIVDTPGTNVILERQQRLTEEYVPRADLVLFVMSADRPFSESEVRFLEYIRQWQKKVVFVVNKADILEGPEEVAAVKDFVASNAARILRLDRPAVIAVSSRAALRAKLAAAGLSATSSAEEAPLPPAPSEGPSPDLDSLDAALAASPAWVASNFAELERRVSTFLVGGGPGGGGEGVRLKLQTPLFVADALLGAAGRQLEADLVAARAEVEGLALVARQLRAFAAEMDKDAAAQRAALQQVLAGVLSRSERFVDSTVQLANAPLLLSIAAGNKAYPFRAAFEKEVVGGGFESLRTAVAEHSSWLRANCDAQRAYYSSFASQRAAAAGVPLPASSSSNGTSSNLDRAASGALASTSNPAVSSSSAPSSPASPSASTSPALALVSDFNVRAVATLLDTELQGAMATTAGTALGAPLVGLFGMQIINNTLEDLLLAGLTGAVSYVSLLNLPLRRADLKGKISRVAGNFLADVQAKMAEEAAAEVGATLRAVAALVAPLEAAYGAEVARLEARQAQLAESKAALQELQRRAANLE